MEQKFDIDKIVNYLDKYKSDLPKLYTWDAKIERLAELEVLTQKQIEEINKKKPYEKALHLKKIVGQNLKETYINDKTLFYEICLWIIRDWGGIFTANDNETIKLIESFLNKEVIEFQRIASISKVSSYLYPEKNIIYDSRVAYSLNWIILSENAGQKYFPIPKGRNSKMIAFDLNVLIRLKNISIYQPNEISDLDKKFFIKNLDKQLFIDKKIAYSELNKLIKDISEKLWKDDIEKQHNLYYTEMLLFAIADREVFLDITKKWIELTK